MDYVVTQVAKPQINKVPQMGGNDGANSEKAVRIYVQNALVSLASVKMNNPQVECILNCDFDIDSDLAKEFEKLDIRIHRIPFGKYSSDDRYIWAITQYKFDSLSHMLDIMQDGDRMIQLDADTVCVGNLDEIYQEADEGIILYVIDHGYCEEHRSCIRRNCARLYGENVCNVIHYGGEFFAGCKKYMTDFLISCQEVMDKMKKTVDLEPWDDEQVISIAASYLLKGRIYPAGAYISRYWTNRFYLVSTNYCYNPVKIWHLPAEKKYGMMVLFNYYMQRRKLPSIRKIAVIMGLPGSKYKRWNLYRWGMRILNKLKN